MSMINSNLRELMNVTRFEKNFTLSWNVNVSKLPCAIVIQNFRFLIFLNVELEFKYLNNFFSFIIMMNFFYKKKFFLIRKFKWKFSQKDFEWSFTRKNESLKTIFFWKSSYVYGGIFCTWKFIIRFVNRIIEEYVNTF